MERSFQLLLLVYGAFMLFGYFLQKRLIYKKVEPVKSWMKFLFFNAIMLGLVISLELIPYAAIVLFSVISVGGLMEIYSITLSKKGDFKLAGILLYLFLFSFFLYGAFCLSSSVLIVTLVLVAVFDGFSQLGGKLIGKRKLAPVISPNKTWEGLAIGTLACLGGGFILLYLNVLTSHNLFLTIPILALAGDLIASVIKRRASVKDFSKAIPYQGGFLDRFDSYVFTVSVLTLINLI